MRALKAPVRKTRHPVAGSGVDHGVPRGTSPGHMLLMARGNSLMSNISYASLIALASASLSTPAFAQVDPDASGAGSDAIVVTATRSGEGIAADKLGGSVTILDSVALDQRQTRIVSDILRDVPGVAVSRTGAVGGLTQIRIRGTEGNHVLVLVDGIEVSDPYNGEYDFGALIADPEARIEVLRGQQSALYGSDAIGGVIHYMTLSGADAPGFVVRGEGGSFGTFNGAARAAGNSGTFDYAISGAYNHTNGTPSARNGARDIGSDIVGLSAKIGWQPTDGVKINAVARYSLNDAQANNSDNDFTSPTFGYLIDSPGVHFRNQGFYGLLGAEFTGLDGRWITNLSGQFADITRKNFDGGALDFGSKGRRYKGSAVTSLRLGDDAFSHRLTAAVDVEREQFRTLSTSPFAFIGERHIDNVGIVGEYELAVRDVLNLGASVRRDENDRFADATTFRVQGSLRVTGTTRLRGAYGTGIKNPGYFELYGYSDGRYIGNPNLKPEKSKGWEAGVDQAIGSVASFGVTYFDSRLQDEIFVTYPAPAFVATPANRTTLSKQHGLEFLFSLHPMPQIRLDANYTLLRARENGAVEVRRPRHSGSVNATVMSADQRFSGTLTLRYNGAQTDAAYIDPSFVPVTVRLKDYALVNLNAEYRLLGNLSIFGRIENLTDEDYEDVFSVATPGRAAYAGVKARF